MGFRTMRDSRIFRYFHGYEPKRDGRSFWAPYHPSTRAQELREEELRHQAHIKADHIAVISTARVSNFENIYSRITALRTWCSWSHGRSETIPTNRKGKNIFEAIYKNSILAPHAKRTLVELILKKGYHEFYNKLLAPHIFTQLDSMTALSYYKNYLCFCKNISLSHSSLSATQKEVWTLTEERENQIWDDFIVNRSAFVNDLTLELLQADPEKAAKFITKRLNASPDPIKLSEELSTLLKNADAESLIQKKTKNELLEILLNAKTSAVKSKDRERPIASPLSKKELDFLSTRRVTVFNCVTKFFPTSSKEMLDLMDQNPEKAKTSLVKTKRETDKAFEKELKKSFKR